MRTWRELGVEPRLFVLDDEAAGEERRAGDVVAVPLRMPGRHAELRRQITARDLATAVLDWEPDIAYTRPFLFAPAMDRLFRRIPTVCEINTDDTVEFPGYASRMMRLHNPTRHLTMRRMDGFVFVTEELSASPVFQNYSDARVVIGNGIDLREISSVPAPSNHVPRVLFLVGSEGPWLGIDKFARLASLLPDLRFDLVGRPPEDIDFPTNVHVHGYLRGDDLDAVFDHADIALGALALHRNGMSEACSLKVRECLARGIPMVLSHRDTDLPSDADYLCYLSNTEDNVDRGSSMVREFAVAQVGKRADRDRLTSIGLVEKERRRLAFLGSILD